MKIYALCIDPERGRYIAISADDETIAFSWTSENDAVGNLVSLLTNEHAVEIGPVIFIDTSDARPGPSSSASPRPDPAA